jgi:hypothetical protein
MTNVVNLNKDDGKKEDTLEQVAGRIRKYIYDANGHDVSASRLRLWAGQELIAVRSRVEAKGFKWNKWCEDNIGRSRSDIHKLMKLAKDSETLGPDIVIENEREKNREQKAEQRERDNSFHNDVSDVRDMESQRYEEPSPP